MNNQNRKREDDGEKNNIQKDASDDDDNIHLLDYFKILPKYETLQKTHPVLWSEKTMIQLFGKNTMVHTLVKAYQTMIASEYDAFCKASSIFSQNINREEYTTMRIHVMSRSFGPGPPGLEEEVQDPRIPSSSQLSLKEELEYYRSSTGGVNLTKGCRAMSPILDMWDHHARPNVEWMYVRNQRAFVIKVLEKEIEPWNDIMVSYGMYTDSHLFAKFGFVNGDGSGHTEVSIAAMHQTLDVGLGQQYSFMKQVESDGDTKHLLTKHDKDLQRKHLLQYLVADDGYEECIEKKKNLKGYQLKLLKYQHLQAIANKRERWILKFQPRNEESKPAVKSSIPIQNDPPRFNPQRLKFDGSGIIPTCRLLALTNDDYDGKAIEVLKDALTNGTADTFEVNRQTDELEYRALVWLARLTNMALKKYPSTVKKDMEKLSSPDVVFQSKEWNAIQVRLGEMQSLESLRSIASSGTRHMMERIRKKKKNVDVPALNIRHKMCSFEHTQKLFEESWL